MNDIKVTLKKEGKDFLLTLVVGTKVIIKDRLYKTNELISDQLTIMQMIESKIKTTLPNECILLNQQLSHVLPMSIMSELKRIRKR